MVNNKMQTPEKPGKPGQRKTKSTKRCREQELCPYKQKCRFRHTAEHAEFWLQERKRKAKQPATRPSGLPAASILARRKKVRCRFGERCRHFQQGNCHFKHGAILRKPTKVPCWNDPCSYIPNCWFFHAKVANTEQTSRQPKPTFTEQTSRQPKPTTEQTLRQPLTEQTICQPPIPGSSRSVVVVPQTTCPPKKNKSLPSKSATLAKNKRRPSKSATRKTASTSVPPCEKPCRTNCRSKKCPFMHDFNQTCLSNCRLDTCDLKHFDEIEHLIEYAPRARKARKEPAGSATTDDYFCDCHRFDKVMPSGHLPTCHYSSVSHEHMARMVVSLGMTCCSLPSNFTGHDQNCDFFDEACEVLLQAESGSRAESPFTEQSSDSQSSTFTEQSSDSHSTEQPSGSQNPFTEQSSDSQTTEQPSGSQQFLTEQSSDSRTTEQPSGSHQFTEQSFDSRNAPTEQSSDSHGLEPAPRVVDLATYMAMFGPVPSTEQPSGSQKVHEPTAPNVSEEMSDDDDDDDDDDDVQIIVSHCCDNRACLCEQPEPDEYCDCSAFTCRLCDVCRGCCDHDP